MSSPLREGQHFDQALGGIAGFFENIRSNTQGIQNSHLETAKSLDGSVLPILGRLHGEIKAKAKELQGGAGQAAKAVDAARNASQGAIERLGEKAAAYDAAAGRPLAAADDPYVLHRGIQHRLHRQVLEENNGRRDLVAVQHNFAAFEAHVLQTLQQAMGAFLQAAAGHADRAKAMYGDVAGSVQRVPLDFEWTRFVERQRGTLIDEHAPPREVAHMDYPNATHAATKPLVAGTLERKSRAGVGALGGGYKPAFYAVTPARYLHQFADADNFRHDPVPELSLYLPDCAVGAVDGARFHVKGKDVSRGKVGNKFAMSHELSFQAPTAADARAWHDAMVRVAGGKVGAAPEGAGAGAGASPTSAGAGGGAASPTAADAKQPAPLHTEGLPQGATPGSATQGSAAPASAATTGTAGTASSAGQTSGTTAASPETPATAGTMASPAGAGADAADKV